MLLCSDESFEENSKKTKKRKMMKDSSAKHMSLPPGFSDKLNALRPPQGHQYPPQMTPQLYHHMMQQRMLMMGPRPMMGPDGRPMMGPDGRPMMGPDGRSMMGPDGRPSFPQRDPNFRMPPPYPGQGPPHYRPGKNQLVCIRVHMS